MCMVASAYQGELFYQKTGCSYFIYLLVLIYIPYHPQNGLRADYGSQLRKYNNYRTIRTHKVKNNSATVLK